MKTIKVISKETIYKILDVLYMLSKSFAYWYIKKFFHRDEMIPQLELDIVCPDCGSTDYSINHFGNGAEYYHCYDCGRNWMK